MAGTDPIPDDEVNRLQSLYEQAAGVGAYQGRGPSDQARAELVAEAMERNEHLNIRQQQALVTRIRGDILRLREADSRG